VRGAAGESAPAWEGKCPCCPSFSSSPASVKRDLLPSSVMTGQAALITLSPLRQVPACLTQRSRNDPIRLSHPRSRRARCHAIITAAGDRVFGGSVPSRRFHPVILVLSGKTDGRTTRINCLPYRPWPYSLFIAAAALAGLMQMKAGVMAAAT